MLVFSCCQHVLAKSSKPIVLVLNDWPSQRVLSRAYGQLLASQGYKVEYLEIAPRDQWGAFKRGLVHFQVEVWQTNHNEDLAQVLDMGFVEGLGNHNAVAREEWWYPSYVQQWCPQLPDWRAINECAGLFSNWQSKDKAVYYAGPWQHEDSTRIRALELNVILQRLNSESALWKVLENAEAVQKPVLLFNWTPNWTDARVEGSFIEFPEFEPECLSEPSWGINKSITHDCGYIKSGWIKKIAVRGAEQTWPCAYQILQNFTLNNVMIGEAAALVVKDGLDEATAASNWLQQYADEQDHWLPDYCEH